MLASTRRRLEMGARALEFSRQQPNPSAGYAAAVARLEERLTRAKVVERQEVDGRSEVRAASVRKRELRRLVRGAHLNHLSNVAQMAAVEEPELVQKFAFPRDATTYRAFQTAAGSMAAEAESRKDLLIKHGLSEEVLSSLKVALDEFETAVEQGSAGRLAHVGAHAELDAIADEVFQIVRVMNGLNRIRFAQQPDLWAKWGSASNVVAAPQSEVRPEPDGTSPSSGEVRPAA